MKLRKKQRESLLAWIAEGLETGEINKRAAKFKPAFSVTRQQVDYYRGTRDVSIDDLKENGEYDALKSGLAIKENRVKLLEELAQLLKVDIFQNNLLWLEQAKGLGSGENYERYDYREFNTQEVAQLRGILDDIAAEVGERVRKQELTGKDGKPLIPPKPKLNLSSLTEEELDAVEKAVLAIERVAGDPETPAVPN